MVAVSRQRHARAAKGAAQHALLELFISRVGSCSPTAALELLYQPAASSRRFAPLRDQALRHRAHNSFNYLLDKQYISFQQRNGAVVLELTPKACRRIERSRLEAALGSARNKRRDAWDGNWRLILFDIPAEDRVKRNAIRAMIRKLGATLLQKSVWVYPYGCEKELGMLADYFELSQHKLRIVVSSDIGDDTALRKHFRIPQQK